VLYDDVYDRVIADLSRDFEIPRRRARALVDGGPYVTPEAVELGLVDGAADELDLEQTLEDAFGGRYARQVAPSPSESRRWGGGARVGVVVIDGDIVDGDNVDIPLLELHMSGGRTVTRAIDRLAADPTVAAIVLRVDSPGGSALASDQIWRAVVRARRRKPVIASMGALAASGGYYVACAAEEIWADPSTLTGSIGIFFGKADVSPLAARIGVSIEEYGRGRHAGLESIYRPFTAEERALVADKIRIWYRLFLRRVAAGRDMDVEAVHAIAQGRVWSGDAALRVGLVDRLGGFGSALARARELADLDADAPTMVVPVRPTGWLDYILGTSDESFISAGQPAAGAGGTDIGALPVAVRRAIAPAFLLANTREGIPLARMEEEIDVR
jgi:protease-4